MVEQVALYCYLVVWMWQVVAPLLVLYPVAAQAEPDYCSVVLQYLVAAV